MRLEPKAHGGSWPGRTPCSVLVFAVDGTQQTTLAVWAWIVALAHQSQAWTREATRAFPEHVCALSVSLSEVPQPAFPHLEQPSHLARLRWLTPLFLDPEALLWGGPFLCPTVSIPDPTPGSHFQGSLKTSCLGLSDKPRPPAVGVPSGLTAGVQLW